MNSKIFTYLKKVVAVLVITLLCSTSSTYAFSFGTQSGNGSSSFMKNLITKLFNNKDYELSDLKIDLEKMQNSGNIDLNKITDLINKLPNGTDKNILEYVKELAEKISGGNTESGITSILTTLLNTVKSLLGGSGSNNLPVEPKSIYMTGNTAGEFAGKDYAVKLHASVYTHVDDNGNPDSDKWAFLIHPNSLSGETIANDIGSFYYEKGYNIFAPDLRGAGDSEGKNALGFLDSLDVYDWLTKLNNEYNTREVIVHGISLGGATTNFLSGIDGFMNNGPVKMSKTFKSIRELKVVGLVVDCGYTDMADFTSASSLTTMGIGLNEETVDYYSKATNSLKYCDLPMLIIQGTNDIMVKAENADIIKNTVKGDVEVWMVEGKNHAFIIMGQETEAYKEHVQAFIDKCENEATEPYEPQEPVQEPDDNTTNTEPEQEETQSFLQKILDALKIFKK